ncbi:MULTISPECIES: SCO7613 C-terminal domain-containing membrane protein [unclassified Cryobacterium]|uniref:SCO7613 C-terminal domain-containing membrane protein n=1 Tax=unclassified Cryobacterium TaxID=2649013 RepID=UPI001068EE64|nr:MULTISPECIES: hypothetical protein [unclassified Cryobacterium]TFB93791.1 hypothetical protein E3O39_15755 [Cryobacterium sp. MDB2-A-1]TFC14778.1 hypothetical protein E3O35_02325 [Cryobacterium sp. MDB2-A-2]TFC19076.1 hypothetical protein E3O51_07155 [Cryobacterium sp. MDB2-10]
MSDPAGGDSAAPDPFAQHAGTVLWPGSLRDLTDTTLCPACQTPLAPYGCPSCGLDLRHPVAAELLAVSTDAAKLLDRRVALIGRLRFDAARARAAAQQVQHTPTAPAPAPPLSWLPQPPATAPLVVPIAAWASTAPSVPVPSEHATPTPSRSAPALSTPALSTPAHQSPPRQALPKAAPAPRDPSLPPKRSSVQILLLVVGVTLVSVAAIFFLTVAWIFAGLLVRSLIVGAFTAGALVTAAVLKRRGLGVTAEGIGALAVVLVLLDAWSLRQNDLFGLGAAESDGYWGVTLLVCTGLFLGWHAVSGLRVASVAGFAAAAPGLGLLVSAAAVGQDDLTRVYLAFLGASVGALIHRFTRASPSTETAAPVGRWPGADRAPERAIVFGFAVVSLLGALATAPFVDTGSELSPLWLLGAVALVAAVHSVTILGVRAVPPAQAPADPAQSVASASAPAGPGAGSLAFACFCSAVAALALALIALIVAIRTTSIPLLVTAPLLVALTLALGLELVSNRAAGPRRTAERVAALTAALAAGYFALATVSSAAWPLGVALVRGLTVFASDPGRPFNPLLSSFDELDNPVGPNSLWALSALVAAGALAAVIWHAGGLLHARTRLVAAVFAATLVLAVPFAGQLPGSVWLVTLLFGLLGGGALFALLAHQRDRLPLGSLRPIVLTLVIVSVSLGFLVGWARSDTWWIGTATGILALVVARGLLGNVQEAHIAGTPDRPAHSGREQGRGALLAGALLLTLLAVVVAPWALTLGARPPATVLLVDQLRGLTLATALLQLFFAVPLPRWVQPTERRWAFRTLLAPTILAFALPVGDLAAALDPTGRAVLLQPEPAAAIIHTVLLLTAAVLWLTLRGNRAAAPIERLTAIVAIAPVLFLLFGAVLRAADAPATVADVAAPAAAILCCALGLTLGSLALRTSPGTVSRGPTDRLALEVGALLVLGPATITAIATSRPLGWVALLLAGLAALLAAIAPDGLFGSHSARRHLGWVALCLGIAGLWLGLSRSGTEAVEPYVLPVAAVLLVLAALIRRFGLVDRRTAGSPVAAWLTLAGLLVALVPVALVAGTGPLARPLAVSGVSAALLLTACALRWTPPRSGYLAAAAASGTLGLLVTSGGRIVALLRSTEDAGLLIEAWLLPALLVLVVAGILSARSGRRMLGDASGAGDAHVTARLAVRTGYGLLTVAVTFGSLAEVLSLAAAAPDETPLAAPRVVLLALACAAAHVGLIRWDRTREGRALAWAALGGSGVALLGGYLHGVPVPLEIVTVPVGLVIVGGRLLAAGQFHSPVPATAADSGAARSTRFWIQAGLLLAVLPSATIPPTPDGSLLRPILVLTFGGALAIAGATLTATPAWRQLAWPAVSAGLVAVLLTALNRVSPLLDTVPAGPDSRLEGWLLPAAVLVAATGIALGAAARRGPVAGLAAAVGDHPPTGPVDGDARDGIRFTGSTPGPVRTGPRQVPATDSATSALGYGLVILAMAGVLGAEVAALGYAPLATIRVVLLAWTFSAVHVTVFQLDPGRAGRWVAWLAIAAGGVAVLAGYGHGVPHPIEIVSVPLALALVTSGWLHLEATPSARSWPWLAPGLFVLLGPSLLLDVTESPLWRVVGLGVLAVAVLLAGLWQRLQAPFVLGAVVLLVHGLAQLWPWIALAYEAVAWWLWLGIGGTLLIVLAARYEQRIRALKQIALGISSLR